MRLPGLAFRLTGISAIDQSLFPGRARFLDTNARHALPSKVVLSATSHVGLYGLSSVSTPSQSICTCSAYVNDLCVMSFPAGRMALAGSTSSENMYLASRNERTVYWPVLCAALRRLGTLGACMPFGSSPLFLLCRACPLFPACRACRACRPFKFWAFESLWFFWSIRICGV